MPGIPSQQDAHERLVVGRASQPAAGEARPAAARAVHPVAARALRAEEGPAPGEVFRGRALERLGRWRLLGARGTGAAGDEARDHAPQHGGHDDGIGAPLETHFPLLR